MFQHSTVVQVSFSSVIKAITLKIHILCFVLINSILFKLLCVWIFPLPIKTFPQWFLNLIINLIMTFWNFFCPFFFLTDKRRFLMEMRGYMPPAHRRFITAVENQTKSLRSLGTSSFFFKGKTLLCRLNFRRKKVFVCVCVCFCFFVSALIHPK